MYFDKSYQDYCNHSMRDPESFRWIDLENVSRACAKWAFISAVVLGGINLVIWFYGLGA